MKTGRAGRALLHDAYKGRQRRLGGRTTPTQELNGGQLAWLMSTQMTNGGSDRIRHGLVILEQGVEGERGCWMASIFREPKQQRPANGAQLGNAGNRPY